MQTAMPATVSATAAPSQVSAFKISTIRVAPERLDTLMTHAGELSATKLRIERRLMQIEEVFAFWEEWTREVGSGPGQQATRNGRGALDGQLWQRHAERLQKLGEMLGHLKSVADEDTARLHYVSSEIEQGIHSLRLLPLSTVFNLFPRMVHDLARQQEKEIDLVMEGGETAADKRVLEDIKDPLMHLIRNAIDHGIESPAERERRGKPRGGTIRLKGYQTASNIVIEVTDDGRGLDLDDLRAAAVKRRMRREEDVAALTPAEVQELIFTSGFSTSPMVTDLSGRGVGLDVVRRNVETLKGTIKVESSPGAGCTMRIQLPVTLAAARVLIAEVDGWPYALPVEAVAGIRLVSPEAVFSIEGRDTIEIDRMPLSVVELSKLLELRTKRASQSAQAGISQRGFGPEVRACIVISTDHERLGLFVDALLDEQEVVLKPLCPLLARVRNVSGTTILGTGEVCTVLNPQDLIKSARKRRTARAAREAAKGPSKKHVVLLAEDSITTRTQEKRILESAGYEVVTAVDGLDAFNKLHTRPFDALVSDVQMPNLDGLSLTEKVRQDRRCKDLPVILVTALSSEEDKKRGIEVGANAYITKPAFDQSLLLETLARLICRRRFPSC
jgi:two-component system chemotaxis sensor kinase CheA